MLSGSQPSRRYEGNVVEMHQIRYFLAVSETLNLTKAAERCNVAQPSLTRAIQALEAELGGELIRRERNLSHLTELGQRVLPMLRQCYETAVSAKSVAASMRNGEVVPLSLALSHTIGLEPFEPMLQELSRVFPGLELKLHRGSRNEVVDYLKSRAAQTGLDPNMMSVEVTSVSFQQDQARATVYFRPKNGPANGGMQMNYVLDRKGSQWVVRGRTESGANPHGVPPAGGAPGTPALPPNHPSVGSPQ